MAFIHGTTTAVDVLKGLATALTTGADAFDPTDNWEIVKPATGLVADITNVVTFKVTTITEKIWIKREKIATIAGATITVANNITGNSRVLIVDGTKKFYLYLKKGSGDVGAFEYKLDPSDAKKILVNAVLNGTTAYVDYEKQFVTGDTTDNNEYFVRLSKPTTTEKGNANNYYIEWMIGTGYDEATDTNTTGIGTDLGSEDLLNRGFPTDMCSIPARLSWFKESSTSVLSSKSWCPIEFWISFDKNSATGVIMGDPGLSEDYYLSSPFYFGMLGQIDGALNTDLKGNFGGFAGSYYEPDLYTSLGASNPLYKVYGDYTGNGSTDMIMAYSKTGRPYNMHKFAVFGAYEFREKTFNGQSAHTGKHSVSEIIVGDVHENDRGKLRRCLASPKVGKEHGTELIYNRYISGEEETYLFLHINAPYTPFNTSPDVLLGLALRMDI